MTTIISEHTTQLVLSNGHKYTAKLIINHKQLLSWVHASSVVSNSLQPHGLCSLPGLVLCPWDFPDMSTGVGCHSFFRGSSQSRNWTCIFCVARQILYHCTTWEVQCPMSSNSMGFPGGSAVKSLPAMHETLVWSLCQEDPLEEGMATHSKYSCLENPMDRGALAGCSP